MSPCSGAKTSAPVVGVRSDSRYPSRWAILRLRGRAAPLEHEQGRVIGQLVGVMREQFAYDPTHGLGRVETACELNRHQLGQPLDPEELSVG